MNGAARGVGVRDVAKLSEPDFAELAQQYRRELHAYCYPNGSAPGSPVSAG